MSERYPLLDAARGLAVALVVLHHLCYDLDVFCGVPLPFLQSPLFLAARLFFVCALFVLSGVSCSLSRNNAKRGAYTLLLAAGVTAVTVLLAPKEAIRFGVLHCLGACRLLWAAGFGRIVRQNPARAMFVSLLAASMLRRLPEGLLLLPLAGGLALPELPGLGWLGFPDAAFHSADFFPLLPWAPVYFAGGALGAYWDRAGFPLALRRDPVPALSLLGRHTLSVYLLHQPLLLLLLWPLMR